ncbi:MAG: hypothetical protein K1X82_03625 [Bacteroidia bacterium]|nr:hypothetical protein [Bacteroidia bacterium]
MKKNILYSSFVAIAGLGLIASCSKNEPSVPSDLIAPEVTIVSPPPARDTIINGQLYKIYSSYQSGSYIPLMVNITDDVGLDSIYVEVVDSNSLSKLFVGSWYSASKTLDIDTGLIAPNVNSICSIKVVAIDQNGNEKGFIRAFGIQP